MQDIVVPEVSNDYIRVTGVEIVVEVVVLGHIVQTEVHKVFIFEIKIANLFRSMVKIAIGFLFYYKIIVITVVFILLIDLILKERGSELAQSSMVVVSSLTVIGREIFNHLSKD